MRKSRFADSQIIAVLKQAEKGATVPQLCREQGISSATIFIRTAFALIMASFLPIAAAQSYGQWQPSGAVASGCNGTVNAVVELANGDLVIGGKFTACATTKAQNLVRFSPSTGAWTPFGTGANNTVRALLLHNNILYIGGSFTVIDNRPMRSIAQWTSAGFSAVVGADLNGSVNAFVANTNGLYIGGNFTRNGTQVLNYIARWDGQSWQSVGIGFDDTVNALFLDGTTLFAGGFFRNAGGEPSHCVAQWNGATWQSMAGGVLNSDGLCVVDALTKFQSELYVGGNFAPTPTGVANIARWNGTQWIALVQDAVNAPNGSIRGLTIDGNELLVAGRNGISVPTSRYFGRWNGKQWNIDPGLTPSTANSISYLTKLANNDLIAVSLSINQRYDEYVSRVQRRVGTTWTDLASAPVAALTTRVYDTALFRGELYAAGDFQIDGNGTVLNGIGRWDGSQWRALGTGVASIRTSSINALEAGSDGLYVGGSFSSINGIAANNIARWDGTAFSSLGNGPSNGVNVDVIDIISSPQGLVLSGSFTQAGGVSVSGIARWNGSSFTALPGASAVRFGALEVYQGDVVAAGVIQLAGSTNTLSLARWNGSNWSTIGSNLAGNDGGGIAGFAAAGAKLYAVGSLGVGGNIGSMAEFDGSNWSLVPGAPASLSALSDIAAITSTIGETDIFVGGFFGSIGGVTATHIARWDGYRFSALSTAGAEGADRRVQSIRAIDGKLYVGGDFLLVANQPSASIAIWQPAAVGSFFGDGFE